MTSTTDRPTETPAARPVLGITAKSVHADRLAKKRVLSNPDGALAAKSMRYRLQRAAAGLMFDAGRPISEQPHRVTSCNRSRKGEKVTIWAAADGRGARYTGLVTCGSVWHCPVCSAKITEARRRELQAGLVAHQATGGEAYLMTLTNPHTADLPIAEQLDKQAKARQRLKNSRTWKRIMAKYGRTGSVCSLETTYGVNGWHPHVHELIFARPGLLNDAAAVADLRAEWIRILFKVGLGNHEKLADMHAHAFDLAGGNYAAEYIAKFGREPSWSEAHELTKSHAKIGGRSLLGKGGHVTPFKLLEWYLAGDEKAGALFREYALAFEGKRMLSWSPGLKRALGVADLTDDELAGDEEPMPDETIVAQLDGDEWRLVLERDARGELLYIAAKNGAAGVACFLVELREHRPRTHSGYHDSHASFGTKLDYFSFPKKAA